MALFAALLLTLLGWGALLFGSVDPNPDLSASAGDVVPDLVATVDVASDVDDEWLAVARRDLEGIPGVVTSSVDWLAGDLTAFYLGVDDAVVQRRSLDRIVADVELALGQSVTASEAGAGSIDVSGRLVVEEELRSSYRPAVMVLVMLAVVVGAAAALWIHWLVGLLVMVSLAGSTVLAPLVTRQLIGAYDGTIASTDVIPALVALVVSALVCWRITLWFRQPSGDDGAAMIQRSVLASCTAVASVGFGLVAVASVLSVFGLITHPVWSTASAVLLAVVWSGSVMAVGMAVGVLSGVVDGASDPEPAVRGLLDGVRAMPGTPPVILAAVAALVLLSVFAFGQPGRQLATADQSDQAGAADDLFDLGAGNPTEGLVVTLDESSSATIDEVAATVVPLTAVAWVDTATARYIGADAQPAIDGVTLLSPSVLGRQGVTPEDLNRSALIVPAVPLGGEDGAELLDDIRSFDGLSVSGPALADLTSRGSGGLTLVTLVLLALMAGLVAYLRSPDRPYTATVLVLGLLLGSASLGLYRIVAGQVPAAESLAVLVLVSTVFLIWALAFAGSRPTGVSTPATERQGMVDVRAGDGVLVTAGLMVVAALLLAVAMFLGSGPATGRFGTGLAFVTAVCGLIGMVILGPAMLGQGAVFHRLVRPFRSALHPDRPSRSISASLEQRNVRSRWTDVAADLMVTDFHIQGEPDAHREHEVALQGTPIFDELRLRQARMREAGLRVAGDRPLVRRVDLVRDGRCPSISMTVDHPERKLVTDEGKIVGVRRPERKSMVMWLASDDAGRFVIAELVETGTYPLEFVDLTNDRTEATVLDLSDGADQRTVGDAAL